MKKPLFAFNLLAFALCFGALFLILLLRTDIKQSTSLVQELHEIDTIAATPERREESVKNLLVMADSRLDRSVFVTNIAAGLSVVAGLVFAINCLQSRKQKSAAV